MSEEARRVFKMETILGVIAGKSGADVADLLGYLAQRELSTEELGAVAPIAKGWLYSLEPRFMACAYSEEVVFEEWAQKQVATLGDNVSIEPIPAAEMAGISVVLDKMAEAKATIAAQVAEVAELKGKVAELAPFEGKTATLEKQVADLTGKLDKAKADLTAAQKELKTFDGKVAINEKEIESSVKDMVSKGLKEALANLPVGAAVAGAVAGEAAAADEPAGFEDSSSSGEVPDTFGFGASGASDDGFGF
ncbi:hypothetical protein N1030_16830 [Desulfovibrio mangrovi]|uniref:hypothetical protein n=1 Tax=Desulfovibrio mangrovi TaxID=2976983 RepID=UPI002246E8B3|nr:hypothetical protein [Desulfovibrio mangrovi]UZP67237.1 hypothetical protein N1030_16830 [Desulfovibrio mangrovi]